MLRRGLGFATAAVMAVGLALSGGASSYADTLPDAYTQIVNRQVPIQPDGAPTYLPYGWGRYYTGPNGLEIRLSNDATWNAVTGLMTASYSTIGLSEILAAIGAGISKSTVAGVLSSIGYNVVSPWIDDAAHHAVLNNRCLGITVPDGGVGITLDRGFALATGNLVLAFSGNYYGGIKTWLEPCSSGSGLASSATITQVADPPPAPLPASPIIYAPPATPTPPSVPWNFENLDGDAAAVGHNGYDLGRQPASVDLGGVLHVFYHDASNGYLRHAWSDASGWHFEILDGAGGASGRIAANLGGTPAITILNGGLQLYYYDFTHHTLRHAWSPNGTSWNFEHLDGASSTIPGHSTSWVGKTPNAVVTPDGRLQLFYYDETLGNLRHAWADAAGWHFENLDGDAGSLAHLDANLGTDPVSVVFNGNLHVFYRDVSNGNLRHAWDLPTTGWHFENLDGDPGSLGSLNADVGGNPSAVIYGTTLQLFYYDATNGNLRHAWDDGSFGWRFENLEGSIGSVSHYDNNVGMMPSATVLGATLQLYYYEPSGGNLRHAYNDSGGWHFENLDGAGGSPTGRYNADVGWDPVAVPYGGHVQLFYYDVTNNNLRHAWSQ